MQAEHEQVTEWFREQIATKQRSLTLLMAAVDELRGRYLDQYWAWMESTRRPNGAAGGIVPDPIRQFGDAVESQQAEIFDKRDELAEARSRYRQWTEHRELGEIEHCPGCAYSAAVPCDEEYRQVMRCMVCEHEQVVHDFSRYRTLPFMPSQR